MKIVFDKPMEFDLTLTRMDNPNSQVNPQDDLRDLIQIDPHELGE